MSADFEQTKRAIARVVAQGGATEKRGTAFLIGNKLALTALHVVADTTSRPPVILASITVQFPGDPEPLVAQVTPGLWDVDDDWAVLQLTAPVDAVPIELGPAPKQAAAWTTFGFPEIAQSGMTMVGDIRDPNIVPLRGANELPARPMMQLFAKEAAAGMGARLHGFSGAPCLVDGNAVGVLRSTLIEEMYDARLQRLLFTQAGTVYATPAASIVAWQADRRKRLLPRSWAPPEIIEKDFIVMLSQQEPGSQADATSPTDKAPQLALRDVVDQAYRRLKTSVSEPYYLSAAQAVASEADLEQCVRALCGAQVVIFDATAFEPAVMFLAGIRAVVRRGITLFSVGGTYALGKEIDVPFNVKDANVVAHSLAQNESPNADSVTLLVNRIRRGLSEIDSPQYFDLPVYEAIRRLPADRRGIIPSEEGVLVLCPFAAKYEKFWQKKLMKALANELSALREEKKAQGLPQVGVSRSLELNSPRLVTQAVYEAIRRMQSCVVDLSNWSASVLFELGVRLAARDRRPTEGGE